MSPPKELNSAWDAAALQGALLVHCITGSSLLVGNAMGGLDWMLIPNTGFRLLRTFSIKPS
jgi:hypothetical protein